MFVYFITIFLYFSPNFVRNIYGFGIDKLGNMGYNALFDMSAIWILGYGIWENDYEDSY